MNVDLLSDGEGIAPLEKLAAELTVAAYQVALQHGVGDKWVDLQLDLWEVMAQALAKRFSSNPDKSGLDAAASMAILAKEPCNAATKTKEPNDVQHELGRRGL